MQTSLYQQKAGQWLPKDEVEGQEGLEGRKGNFLHTGCVHYLDCGEGFIKVHMSKLSKLNSLSMCNLLYVNYISIKLSIFI